MRSTGMIEHLRLCRDLVCELRKVLQLCTVITLQIARSFPRNRSKHKSRSANSLHSLGQPLMHTMDHEQIWNHPCRDPPLTIGSSAFMHPSENITVCGLNSEAYNNTPPTTCHPSLPNFNLEVPCYAAAHAGIAEQPFIHSWSSCNSLQFQPCYIHSEPCPTQFHSGDVNVAVNPPTSFDTVTYKRKIPTIHFFSQNASSNSCLNAGRSSHAVSTELSEPTQPAEDPRTIRSHHVNAHQPGNISLPIHTSNSFSEHLQSVANTSILNVLAQWNHDASSLEPHTRLIPSEINQLHRQPVRNITRETDGQSNFCLAPNQPTRDMVTNHRIMHRQGVGCRQNVSYGAAVGSEANLADMRPTSADGVDPPRYCRQLPSIGHVNGRTRTHYIGDDAGHRKWLSESMQPAAIKEFV